MRKTKNVVYQTLSIPKAYYDLAKEIGAGSPSRGVQLMWKRVKDDQEILLKMTGGIKVITIIEKE